MTYANAKKLHSGDIIAVKGTNEVLEVLRISSPRPMNMFHRNDIFIECSDGNSYHHTKVDKIERNVDKTYDNMDDYER